MLTIIWAPKQLQVDGIAVQFWSCQFLSALVSKYSHATGKKQLTRILYPVSSRTGTIRGQAKPVLALALSSRVDWKRAALA